MGFLKGFLDASFWLINYVLITYWLNRLNWVAVKFSVGWNGGRTKAKKATESSFHRVHLLFASLFHGMNKTGSVWSEGRTPISSLFNILLVTNQLALFLLMLVTPALNRRTTAQYSLDFNRVKLLDIMKQSKPSSSQNVRLNLGNNVPFYLFTIIFFFFSMFSTHTHTHTAYLWAHLLRSDKVWQFPTMKHTLCIFHWVLLIVFLFFCRWVSPSFYLALRSNLSC